MHLQQQAAHVHHQLLDQLLISFMRGNHCQGLDCSLCPVMQRGLAPRVFEYIFKRIAEEEDNAVSLALHWLSAML